MNQNKPQILCVDMESCCEMLDLMLNIEKNVYEFTGMDSAEKALAIIATKKFDLYLVENLLPDKPGIELCRQIRETDAKTPIVFYSVMARQIDRQRAMEAGATEYLLKPNDIDRVAITIQQLLDKTLEFHEPETVKKEKSYSGIF